MSLRWKNRDCGDLEWQFYHVYNLGALCNKDELWQWCFVAEIFNVENILSRVTLIFITKLL